MGEAPRILIVGSVPLAAPWNGADKNFARALVNWDEQSHYIVHTDRDERWAAPRVTPVRTRVVSDMPTRAQKARSLMFLLRHTRDADIVHIIATLKNPSILGAPLIRLWVKANGKSLIHTVPSFGDRLPARHTFFGDLTVVVSEHSREQLLSLGLRNVHRVYPPVDPAALRARRGATDFIDRLEVGPRALLYPAHYGPDSGIREMFEAFARLPRSLDDAVLVLACRPQPDQDPSEEARAVRRMAIELGVGERVRVVGQVPDMAALIEACALTVLVTRQLRSKMDLPLVLLESLALGRAIICSEEPPVSEALLGQGGLMVPPGDVDALAGAVGTLLSDDALRAVAAARGREAVLSHCHPAQVAGQYRVLYRRALNVAGEQ